MIDYRVVWTSTAFLTQATVLACCKVISDLGVYMRLQTVEASIQFNSRELSNLELAMFLLRIYKPNRARAPTMPSIPQVGWHATSR